MTSAKRKPVMLRAKFEVFSFSRSKLVPLVFYVLAKFSLRLSLKVRPTKQRRSFCYVTCSCAFSVL